MKAQSIGTVAAWCGVCMIQSVMADDSAAAGSATNLLQSAKDDWPAFEAAVDFCSRQLTYGLVDNRDPIVTSAAAAEWHGFTFESALIFDTTDCGKRHGDYGNRKDKYQELSFGPGYAHTFATEDVPFFPTAVDTFVNYLYEYHPPVRKDLGESNPHTQFINAGAGLPDLWLAPTLAAEFDIDRDGGAIYLVADVSHSFSLVKAPGARKNDLLALTLGTGIGFGNARRNACDADFDAAAFKDTHASLALDWKLTDRMTLSPYAAAYEQVHRRLREAARHSINGETHSSAQLIGGVRLVAKF